jgi:cysteine desulfurase/selenocysteine lyase
MAMIDPLVSPNVFEGLEDVAHLCTGGEGPWLLDQAAVYERFCGLKSGGYDGRQEIYAEGEHCRERMGRVWNVSAERIAFAPSAAEGMGWLASGLDWREGDNVVTTNLEFPSVAYGWRNLRARGVEVRLVPHRDWVTEEEDLLDAVDERTRVLAVSHVSFYTGQCLDLSLLSSVSERGVLFAVDATHSAGAMVVDANLTDLCVSSCYKWLLATHGCAPCYLSERAEEQTAATCFGWRNLQVWPPQTGERLPEVDEKPMPERMEPGNPAMLAVMQLGCSLELLLETGIEPIQEHDRDLSEQVQAGLESLGLEIISPSERDRRSGNTCFLIEDAPTLRDRLRELGVLTWGEFGRMRISTHLHNGSGDVDRLLKVLSKVI